MGLTNPAQSLPTHVFFDKSQSAAEQLRAIIGNQASVSAGRLLIIIEYYWWQQCTVPMLQWDFACRFASDKDGKRRTVRLEMLAQYRMDGHLMGITVIKAKLAQLQRDALLLTFRHVTCTEMPPPPPPPPAAPFPSLHSLQQPWERRHRMLMVAAVQLQCNALSESLRETPSSPLCRVVASPSGLP